MRTDASGLLDARQLARLDALGVDVYVRRSLTAPACLPGAEPASTVAGDVAPIVAAATPDVSGLDWDSLQATVAACARCELHRTRTQTVFGRGDRQARWMIVGEAPGAEEDRQGLPFVGRAGQLLDTMLRALGLGRDEVYVANILKCRPPGNRDPKPDEAAQCRGYLDRQIALVAPAVILAVGRIAAQNLLGTDAALARLRGRVHTLGPASTPVVVTYHPAYLLRSPAEKRKAWQDLVTAREVFRSRAGRAS